MSAPLFRFSETFVRDPAVEGWFRAHPDELGATARYWFDVMRQCGDDVREILHDKQPTACVADAAFAYVDAFTAHVNVSFFRGAQLDDPSGLLEGHGKLMRHVKIRPGKRIDDAALSALIAAACRDIRARVDTI